MSDADYNNRMESLQRFIPFLENMIEQLKEPKMKNREQQLNKMESLYGMITDKKKKLKIETLIKCEEVIVKLYQKVKGERAHLPASPERNKEEKRKTVDIYSMAGESLNKPKKSNAFDIPPSNKSPVPKSFFLRKPPISYEDLEVLEKDVASELERKMSLQELNSLRNELCQQLEESDADKINTTVRNKPMLTKLNSATPEKNRKIIEKNSPVAKTVTSDKKEPTPSTSKKSDAAPKILKESGDIFSTAFSEIDKTYEIEAKKGEERRSSTSKEKKNKEEMIAEKIAHVRQLAEKAAELRNKSLISKEPAGHCSSKELDKTKEVQAADSELINKITDNPTSSGNVISEKDISELSHKVNLIKETLDKNESTQEKISKDKLIVDKLKSHKESRDDHSKSKKNSDHRRDSSDRKSEHKKDHKGDHKKDEKLKEKRHEKDKKDRDKIKDSGKETEKREKNIQIGKKDKKDAKIIPKSEGTKINKTKDESSETENESNKIEATLEKPTETPKEVKPVNRDPRLKYSVAAIANNVVPAQNQENHRRLAYKYNPKPKRSDNEVDLEKNLSESIEKSMKECGNAPLPPKARLEAPPAPPEDLFSPQSPDEIDKAPVPAILNDILLNPKTTGVINEVVSALKRSNNEKNLLSLVSPGNILNHEMNSHGSKEPTAAVFENNQSLFSQFYQTSNDAFSPPLQKFSTPAVDSQVFLQPKPVPPPLMSNAQPRGFNPFATSMDTSSACDEMPVLDFQPALNAVSNFDRPVNPPHLTPYEDRMGQHGFHQDRGLNFVPPSPSYVAPSNFVPPSPSYVPPSPVYDGNNDNFRDNMHVNNFHNFTGERSSHPQGFFEKDRGRSQGLLGDYPQMQYNSQYGNQNYDMFYNNQSGFMEPRKPFYGGATRDPRINMNRGNQFPGNESRMMGRDSRMTYREHKELKEKENRDRELREREIRDREKRERELIERQKREKEDAELREEEEKERTAHQKEENERNNRQNAENKNEWSRNRSRDRNRDRYSRNRSSSRYRREQDNRRDRSKERPRLGESRFDKVYSSRDKDKEDFTSPLDSLYASSKAKTGKGYGVQFKIPKIVKEEEKQKKDHIKIEKEKEKITGDDKEKKEIKPETCEGKFEKQDISNEEKNVDTEVETSKKNESPQKIENQMKNENTTDEKSVTESINEDVIEVKKEVPVIEIINHPEEMNEKGNVSGTENLKTLTERSDDNKIQETTGKKDEEEGILSKFFQNLMKSSNKDEKKGALLSLISTFSDSFSDQQLKRITNIIRSEENEEVDENTHETKDAQKLQVTEKMDDIHVDEPPKDSTVTEKEHQEMDIDEDKDVDDNSVQVSVGERIKNRKRTEATKPEAKAKIRSKTELDRLHEDIREMFIRDGVVTATGKRMCRILKDNTAITDNEKIVEQNMTEETKKKIPIGKKRGRKAGMKKNPAVDVEMRELSVILPKMSFEKMKESGENSDRRYSLRKQAKTTNYNENEIEEDKNKYLQKPDATGEMEESTDDLEEEEEEELKDWTDVDNSVEEPKKQKPKKKNRKTWAAGVIKKKSGGKTKKARSPVRMENSDATNQKEGESSRKLLDQGQPLHLHEKDYYFRPNASILSCKLCNVSSKWIAAHYRSEHPDIEVLSSRLPPDVAQIAIKDAIANKEVYEADREVSTSKHDYTCRFCDYTQTTLPRMHRDHVSIHTGEFRHKCPYCNYRRSHIKSMQTHVYEAHSAEETKLKRRIISQAPVNFRNIYAYICGVCNYTQMTLQNVQEHVRNYHSGSKIHKIRMNHLDDDQKDKTESEFVQDIQTTPIKERTSTRSSKLSSINSDIDEERAPEKDFENEPQTSKKFEEECEGLDVDKAPPQLTKEEERSKMISSSLREEAESTAIDSESYSTSIDEPIEKKTRKRKKSFAKPRPAKKKGRKKSVRSTLSSTDTETESDTTRSSPRKQNERNKSEEMTAKKIDEAVFTCNTDLQEENKQIEEERLRKMQDINSTIKLRTSLDFVEKLSNRLKQEDGVMVKLEPSDQDEDGALSTLPPNELPVYEKSVQKRESEQTLVRHDGSPDGGKANTIINGVIEKLRGVLNNTAPSDDVGVLPPPLKHMDRVEMKLDRELNSAVLNIGPIKVVKSGDTSIYTCCLPPCIFSSRDQKVFENHCRSGHHWNENAVQFPNCLECDAIIECTENNPLLVSALDHALKVHSSFLSVKIGSIRVSSNLFPETKKDVEKMHEISSDSAISMPPTISIPSPIGTDLSDDPLFSSEMIPENFEDENPFSFKIVDVVSLAEEEVPPLCIIDNQLKSGNIDDELVVPTANMVPVSPKKTKNALVLTPDQKSPEKMIKTPLIKSPNHPKKSAIAMKKFLNAYNDLFKCPELTCLFTTNKRKMFDIHVRMHPNQNSKSMCCLYCDKFIVLDSMGDHYEQVHGMCRFACYYCLYRCIAKDYMDIHQLLVHPELPPRMRVLPKRDTEDKNLISILTEAAKNTPLPAYTCCDEDFVHYLYFISHLDNCPKNPRYVCQFRKGSSEICGKAHANTDELISHWSVEHELYPLQCGYCDVGGYDLSEMMIHLVLEHPTLPPDVIDRFTPPKNKHQTCPSRAQCNFKQLVTDLRTNPSKFKMHHVRDPLATTSTTSTVNAVSQSMQKAFENFVQQCNKQPVLSKSVTTYSKVTPVNVMPATTTTMSMFKASTSNVLTTGGLVYCLAPSSTTQNQLMKALVVNKDSPTGVSSKVRLLSPVSLPPSDPKFQMIKSMHKMIPITPKLPRLSPIAPRIVSVPAIVQPLVLPPVTEVATPSDGGERTRPETNEKVPETVDQLTLVDGGEENSATDGADLPIFEEPMVVIDDDFEDKIRDDAVDPLSLDMEDPLASTKTTQPYSGATPLHEYDSDSINDQQDANGMRKTGLMGYQLYRCAKCDLSFSGHSDFKNHLINSDDCQFFLPPTRPYKCAHCGRFMKHYTNLLDHLGYHGPSRFLCSLCNKKYPHSNQVKYHMKYKHNVASVVMKPLIQNKGNLLVDEFVMRPTGVDYANTSIKEAVVEGDTPKTSETKTIFFSHEADDIPQKSILSYDITCGHCKTFKNKVRSNIVRHLLLHKNDQDFTVPDTAPINPVPCLEKNEKMFDKMFNLASSSHAGGRMGGQQKGDSKKTDKVAEEDHPAFVPTNKRFQCCAVGCNYLCLEEGNLRHHLTALHMEDLNFVCVHCKSDLSDAADVDTILKHLKLHELHLYKCSACKFMHNLRHKIERHIGEKHKNKGCTVVVLRAMDSEPFDETQQVLAPFPVAMNQKSMKQWRCCLCKYRCYTQDEAELHAKNKHDFDCRYKCSLCTFKTNEISEFTGHFKTDHPDNTVDIILAYHKDDDQNEPSTEPDQFDTTPLWLRDKPRVRHIRGILFEENLPTKKKSANVKTSASDHQASTSTATPPSVKKRKRSASVVAEPSRYIEEEEEVALKKESAEVAGNAALHAVNSDDVIVIEDDDEDVVERGGSVDRVAAQPQERSGNELDDIDLLCTFGDVGIPVNKNFKCPKCDKYKTTKMRDFIQHVAREMRYHRFKCSLCDKNFVTMDSIKMHSIEHHDGSIKNNVSLPIDPSLKRWLTILLEKQMNIIRNLGFQTEDMPKDVGDFLITYDTDGDKVAIQTQNIPKRRIMCKLCCFWVTSTQAMNRHLKYNHPHVDVDQSGASNSNPSTSGQISSLAVKRAPEGPTENSPDSKKPKISLKNTLIAKDRYVCSLCFMYFDSVPEMEFHGKESHDGEVTYVVQTTDVPVTYEYGRNIYRCNHCPTIGTKATLEIHSSQDHPLQKPSMYRFRCAVCPAKFENLKNFRQHFKSHELRETSYFDIHDNIVNIKQKDTTNKIKLYKCPECPYISHSVNTANIKTHLKIHARPFQCDLCQMQFRLRPDARSHHLKEHPHNVEMITERVDMIQKIDSLLKEVLRNVQPGNCPTKTAVLEKDHPAGPADEEILIEVEPEAVIDMIDDVSLEREDQRRPMTKSCARKSTGRPAHHREADEYYSFYGRTPTPVDMRKIVTTFEIADAKMRMTCDQLGRIYNIKPRLVLKDCMTLIIEDDEMSS